MTWIKDKENLKTLGLDTARMFGFNFFAFLISSFVVYVSAFVNEMVVMFSGGIEAYCLANYGAERIAFFVIFYDIIDRTAARTESIALYSSYFLMLLFNVIYIRHRRKMFTYDNMEINWESRKMAYLKNNIIGYFIISIVPNIYFLIMGIDGVYKNLHVINTLTQEKGLGTPDYISILFGPQTAFYHMTQSLIFGLFLNFAVYYAVTCAMYMIKRKETVPKTAKVKK